MANQSMGNIVRECCEDEVHFQELSGQILAYVRANTTK